MKILAETMNKCIPELGYSPALLQEHRELKKQYDKLRADNTKLFQDNSTISRYMKAQEQEIQGLKATDHALREHATILTREREEMAARLHTACVHPSA